MSQKYAPWVEKHKPRRIEEIVGNDQAIAQFIGWLNLWGKGAPAKRAILLYGPPGCGKTLLVEVAAQELGYELIEMNASDLRTAEAIQKVVGASAAGFGSLFGARGKIIFLDEVDGVSGAEDKGGLAAIMKIIGDTKVPLVLAANDPWDPKLRPLRDLCEMVRFYRVRTPSLIAYLRKVCRVEGVKADEEALRIIAEGAEGDVRSAVNDLQALAQGLKELRATDVSWLAVRDRGYGAFDLLKMLFSAKTCMEAKKVLDSSMLDYDMLLQWIHENLPLQYEDPEELAAAYEAMSRADVFLGRTRRTQEWGLLSYALDQMTAGVALARKGRYRFIKYQFPSRITLLSQTKARRENINLICAAVAKKCHISIRGAKTEYLPYIKFIFENNVEIAAKLAKWLELDEDMVKLLAEGEGLKKVKHKTST